MIRKIVTDIFVIIIDHAGALGQKTTWALVMSRLAIAKGSKNFQAKAITWSMRSLIKVKRIHSTKKKTAKTFIKNQTKGGSSGPRQPLRKRVVTMTERTATSAYSESSSIANFMPENSML
jgi:hypothetical protein